MNEIELNIKNYILKKNLNKKDTLKDILNNLFKKNKKIRLKKLFKKILLAIYFIKVIYIEIKKKKISQTYFKKSLNLKKIKNLSKITIKQNSNDSINSNILKKLKINYRIKKEKKNSKKIIKKFKLIYNKVRLKSKKKTKSINIKSIKYNLNNLKNKIELIDNNLNNYKKIKNKINKSYNLKNYKISFHKYLIKN